VIVASISLLLDVDEGDVGGRVGIGKLKDKPPGVGGVAVNPGRLPPGPAGGELGREIGNPPEIPPLLGPDEGRGKPPDRPPLLGGEPGRESDKLPESPPFPVGEETGTGKAVVKLPWTVEANGFPRLLVPTLVKEKSKSNLSLRSPVEEKS
jgi:hypothetical protein